jgi:hypothetical protein
VDHQVARNQLDRSEDTNLHRSRTVPPAPAIRHRV